MNLARVRLIVSGSLAAACWLWISAASGQSGMILEGRILDPSGAGIPGAAVTLFSDDRVRATRADNGGKFAFARLTAPVHFLEASSNGFFSGSISVTNQTAGPVTLVLWPGEGGWCPSYDLFTYPLASYEERSEKVQLTGKVADFSGFWLPNASLTLMRADLGTPEARWPNPSRSPSMRERRFQFTYVAQMIANEKGEFQFSGLEPGWYSLIVGHEGYQEGTAKFWIARDSLTRTTLIHLNLKLYASGCDTIFGPVNASPVPLELQYVRP